MRLPERWIALLFASVLSLACPMALHAQSADATTTESVSQSATFSPLLTTYRLPDDKLKQSEALYRTRMLTFIAATIYGIALLILLLNFRVGARFRDLAEKTSSRRFIQAIVFTPLLIITIDALSLPISVYQHSLSVTYGISVQGWGSWFWDWAKNELISIVIVTLLVWGLYAILRRSLQRWWLYGWLATIPVLLLLVFIQPMFIDPLFDKFDPLDQKQPQLVPELEKVMQRGGLSIERARMFEMRASDKVTTYNAYVTGLGASKRVVVWDNTSRDLSIPETMFVFGHEQGHYVLNHIYKGLAFAIAGLFLVFYLAYRLIGGLIARWGHRWDVRAPADWASLPVLLLIFTIFSTVSQPVVAGVIRHMEHEADIYGLEVIHGLVPDSAQVAAHAFQKLGEKGLAYPAPHPLYVLWTYDHPTVADRLQFSATYKPWDDGRPTIFIK